MFFCDWLNAWQQFPTGEYPDFLGGRVISIDGACDFSRRRVTDGETGEITDAWAVCGSDEIEYSTAKFGQHRGSFETTIMIRMVGGRLEVRGNPSAYGRLDNLFGVSLDDGMAIYNEILASIGLPIFTEGEERDIWMQREQTMMKDYTGAHITRADFTVNQAVGMGRVRDYNKWLAGQKLARSSPDDDALEKYARWNYATVYTSNSKYWINSKHYDKAEALEELTLPEYLKKLRNGVREGKIDKKEVRRLYLEAEDYLGKLAEWCAEIGVVRSEWSMRSRWFQQKKGAGWWKPHETESDLIDVVTQEREKIAMRAVVYQEESYESLSASEYKALDQWKKGSILKASHGGTIPDPTFYRLRSAIIKKTGHDIAARPMVKAQANEFRPIYFQVRPLSLADAPVWYQRPSYPMQLAA
jgi:hypothetical protein